MERTFLVHDTSHLPGLNNSRLNGGAKSANEFDRSVEQRVLSNEYLLYAILV